MIEKQIANVDDKGSGQSLEAFAQWNARNCRDIRDRIQALESKRINKLTT